MADRYLLESGSPDGYLLEDSSGVLLLESNRLWLPTDLGSKLLAWLPASALVGADASNINTWTDQSGLGNNGTGNSVGGTARPTLKTSLGPSGGNAVRLSGSSGTGDFFDMPTALLSGTSGVNGAALYGLYKQTTNPPTGTPGGLFGDFGTDALANHDPFTDNTFYEDGLRTARVTTTLTSTSDWQLLGIRSKTNDWRISLNAALDNGSNTSTYYSTTTSTFGANTVPRIGSSGSNANFIDGLISNLVITSDFLTTGEKEQLEGYMLWDAGRPDLLPATHTYKSAAPVIATTVTHATTGVLTGPSSTIAGTAVYNAKHTTTGVLTGSGSTIAGAAAHIAIHGTTGSLTGAGSAIVGSAARTRQHATSGVLTGPGSVIVGAAVYNAKHATSGTLTGQSSTVVGSATRFHAFATIGVLTGPGSTIIGAAVYNAKHTTSGILTGQIGSITGSAARFRAFATTGALIGQGSSIAGSADHVTVSVSHDTSGTLIGPGSSIVGSASRFRTFATSGILTGQGSAISGAADHRTGHWTSGALTGSTGPISGSATRFRAFAASGVLQGQGAVIAGAALIQTHHTTGALVGQDAILLGSAARTRNHTVSGVLVGPPALIAGNAYRCRSHYTSGDLAGVIAAMFGRVFNGTPQLHDVPVDSENLSAETEPGAGMLKPVAVASGQIVNHPPYPEA